MKETMKVKATHLLAFFQLLGEQVESRSRAVLDTGEFAKVPSICEDRRVPNWDRLLRLSLKDNFAVEVETAV